MKWLIAVVFLLTLTTASHANGPFFVATAPTGSDSNNCTSSGTPCATIAHASTLVTAPATVNVAPGIYLGNFTTTATGSAGNVITYQCTTIGACIIRPGASDAVQGYTSPVAVAWLNGGGTGATRGDYVTIDGFEIDGSQNQGGAIWFGGLESTGGHVTMTHNVVHDLAVSNTCNANGGSSIEADGYQGGSNSTIEYNIIHDIGPAGCQIIHAVYLSSPNNYVANNWIYNVNGACVEEFHNVSANQVVNNTLGPNCVIGVDTSTYNWFGNGTLAPGYAVHPFTGASSGTTLVLTGALSNVVAGANGTGWQLVDGSANSAWNCWPAAQHVTGVTVATNTTLTLSNPITCTVSTGDTIYIGPPNTSVVVSNNIIFNGTYGLVEGGGAAIDSNAVYANNNIIGNATTNFLANVNTQTSAVSNGPGFVNSGGGPAADVHLLSTSPNVGAGTATNAPSTDITGQTRVGTPDVGAFEYLTPNPWTTIGQYNVGSKFGPSTAGNPSGFRTSQLQIQGNAYLQNYGSCASFINTNPGAATPQKAMCLNDAGQFVLYNYLGNKLATFWDNGSISYGNYANTHGNLGAECHSNLGLSSAGGAGVVQFCHYILGGVNTTSAQVVQLTSDGLTPGTTNCVNMPDNTAGTFVAHAIANDVTTAGNYYSTVFPFGAFKRGTGAATFALFNTGTPTSAGSGTTTGAGFALTADTTRGCFSIKFTNPSTSDTWTEAADVYLVETPPQ